MARNYRRHCSVFIYLFFAPVHVVAGLHDVGPRKGSTNMLATFLGMTHISSIAIHSIIVYILCRGPL